MEFELFLTRLIRHNLSPAVSLSVCPSVAFFLSSSGRIGPWPPTSRRRAATPRAQHPLPTGAAHPRVNIDLDRLAKYLTFSLPLVRPSTSLPLAPVRCPSVGTYVKIGALSLIPLFLTLIHRSRQQKSPKRKALPATTRTYKISHALHVTGSAIGLRPGSRDPLRARPPSIAQVKEVSGRRRRSPSVMGRSRSSPRSVGRRPAVRTVSANPFSSAPPPPPPSLLRRDLGALRCGCGGVEVN